jgi:hypothetical protein
MYLERHSFVSQRECALLKVATLNLNKDILYLNLAR